MELETNKHDRFPISGSENLDLVYLFWKGGKWKQDKSHPVFEDLPEEGLPVKKIFVDKTTGRLEIRFDPGEEEEE